MFDSRSTLRIVTGTLAALFAFSYFGLLTGSKTFIHDTINWAGIFYYYVDSITSWQFPYWDPYLTGGTYFYPNVPLHGLLDPAVLIGAFIAKAANLSWVTLYNYFRLYKLFVVAAGAYFLYRHITGHRLSALLAAAILFFVLPLNNFRQFGTVDALYLTPFATFFLLRFIEEPGGPKALLFLSLTALVSGISMINYIPSFFLFNVLAFLLAAALLGNMSGRDVLRRFRDRRSFLVLVTLITAVVLMAAPPTVTMVRDASGDGELFPMQRIIQKNHEDFKQLVASDISSNNLSNRFTDQLAPMNTWGALANFIFPDLVTFRYWGMHDLQSEIDHYIGILPLVFCITAIILIPWRYKWLLLLMILVNFVNGFSLNGFNNQQYNLIQRAFNLIFPPLTWYQGRENLGYFVLFFLCAFAALGLKTLFTDEAFLRRRWRFLVGLSAALIAGKIIIARSFAGVAAATSAYDYFVIVQLAALIIGILLLVGHRISHQHLAVAVIILLIADLVAYNENAKEYSLQDSTGFHELAENARGRTSADGTFQYFREPFLTIRGPAFAESVSKIKGALSSGYNHSLFTTKRFYDVFTNIPLETQFALDGVVHPIIRFWQTGETVPVPNRRELLSRYATMSPDAAAGTLFVENPQSSAGPAREFLGLEQYPDAVWLKPERVIDAYTRYLTSHETSMRSIRGDLERQLVTSLYSVSVGRFTLNSITINVRNAVPGYLQYADGWSRYWRAYDGAREIPLLVANYNGKAVFLPPGDHEVRFVFDPRHYRIALAAYAIGLILTIALVLILLRSRRRREEQ